MTEKETYSIIWNQQLNNNNNENIYDSITCKINKSIIGQYNQIITSAEIKKLVLSAGKIDLFHHLKSTTK